MASDNLNQVGKSIKNIKSTADYASKKIQLNKRIERSRDVFDTGVPFDMEFRTDNKYDRATLDLKFTKPPPRKGCNAECFSNNCKTFTFSDGFDHLVNLEVPYISQTLRIFRNRELLDASHYSEYEPEGGLVYVQGSGTANDEITICFVTGDCIVPPFDASNVHWWQGTMTFVNGAGGGGGWGYSKFFIPPTTTTVYSSNTDPAEFLPGATYIIAIGIIIADTDCCVTLAIDPVGVYPPNPSFVFGGFFLGYGGEFTVPGNVGSDPLSAYVSAKAQPTAAGSTHTCNVMWVVDPIDWILSSPEPNQLVINDTVVYIGGGVFQVSFPFILGTLHVFLNDIEVPITEHSDRQFIFVTFPQPTDVITAVYTAA